MRISYTETTKVGKRGVFTIPAPMRKRFGLADGSLVIAEEREDGILLRPAIATPIETYSAERTAEFLLSNATDAADYEAARQEVTAKGLEPNHISHRKPSKSPSALGKYAFVAGGSEEFAKEKQDEIEREDRARE